MVDHEHTDAIRRRGAGPFAGRILVAVFVAAALGAAFAAGDRRDLDLRAVRNVDARTGSGRIVVTVEPGATGVTVVHRGNVSYDVRVQGDTLVVEGRDRAIFCVMCEVSFEIRLPGPAALRLRTTNGSVRVTGAMTRVDAATTNGDVSTVDTGTAPLMLGTTNGRVTVARAHAEVRAMNTNGSVELTELTLPAGSDSRAQTTNGSVTVRGLHTRAALDVTGRVSNGGISVSLDGFTVRYPDSRSFGATVTGDGHASLDLRTVNGSVSVRP